MKKAIQQDQNRLVNFTKETDNSQRITLLNVIMIKGKCQIKQKWSKQKESPRKLECPLKYIQKRIISTQNLVVKLY